MRITNDDVKAAAVGVLVGAFLVAGVSCAAAEPGNTPDRPLYVHCDNVE